MNSIQLGISTQTPPLRFIQKPTEITIAGGASSTVQVSKNGTTEYQLTPGGVSRMVMRSVRSWSRQGWLRNAHWFSLLPGGPKNFKVEGLPLELHHVSLPPTQLRAYASTKEKLWADIHGLASPQFDVEDFRFYSQYNWFMADALLEQVPNVDIAYVQDFQLLQMGALIGLAAPSVLRWHVPFSPQRMPRYTRSFLVRVLEDFDTVIVSTRRDLEGLLDAGFKGHARQLYPHFASEDWPDVAQGEIQAVEERWNIGPEDPVALVVARMDPMKRQDLAIQAIARVKRKIPNVRLILVGNGSFSGAANGGLGLNKAERWANELQRLVEELGLEENVRFAHWIPDNLLAAAYARANCLLLTSDVEGFGTVIYEAWRYQRPVIVTDGCGAAEVITHGLNGYTSPSGDADRMAELLERVLQRSDLQESLGEAGKASLRNFEVGRIGQREVTILEEALARFGEA